MRAEVAPASVAGGSRVQGRAEHRSIPGKSRARA